MAVYIDHFDRRFKSSAVEVVGNIGVQPMRCLALDRTPSMGTTAVRMTVAEFAALPDDDGVKRELIDGEVCEMASV